MLTYLTAVLKPVDADAELAIGVLLAYDLDVLRKKVLVFLVTFVSFQVTSTVF